MIDRPNERKVNQRQNIPLLGGLAVALGFFVGIAIAVFFFTEGDPYRGHLEGLLVGGLLILSVGAFDDRFTLGPKTKLAVQMLAAAIAISYGFEIRHITDPVTRTAWVMPTWLMTTVTMLWIVGITNAMNMIDGLDGLCAGIAAIAANNNSGPGYSRMDGRMPNGGDMFGDDGDDYGYRDGNGNGNGMRQRPRTAEPTPSATASVPSATPSATASPSVTATP